MKQKREKPRKLLALLGKEATSKAFLYWECYTLDLGYMPRGVLGISSDGDDRRIFLGLKFSIPELFWVRKFGKYFFG